MRTVTPVPATPTDIIGREAELESLAGLIEDLGDHPRALLLEGEAGIGKTTLWRWATDRARERGYVVLGCRPAETEASLPFAALGDALEATIDEVLPSLVEPQRVALESALARVEPQEPLGRLAVARAAFAAIKELVERQPVLIAIDDVQWLDSPSAEAFSFIVRRLESLPARVLVTSRSRKDTTPLDLDRALRPEDFSRRWLAPFSIADFDDLLRSRLDVILQRPRLVELHRITRGNPFYALEIARSAVRAGPEIDDEFTVPNSLSELLLDRLAELSREGRDAILLASATLHPTVTLVEKAVGETTGLEEAFAEGMLELVGDRVVFAHPLLASVAYHSAHTWERRDAHGRLAEASVDPLERARHLALATQDADDAIAEELDRAALRAHRLGAPTVAAELADHACRLTPRDNRRELLARMGRGAEYHLAVGDSSRGRALLEEVVAVLPPGPARAELLVRLGRVRYLADDVPAAQDLFLQARAEAGDDGGLMARIDQALAFTTMFGGDIPGAAEHARSSLCLAEQVGDHGLLALSLSRVVLMEFLLGMGFDDARMAAAVQHEGSIEDVPTEWLPSYTHAGIAQFMDDLDTARDIHGRLYIAALERGDERALGTVLFSRSQVESAAGNWARARQYADEAIERSRQSGLAVLQANALSARALVGALLGEEDRTRAAAEEGLEIAGRAGAVAPTAWLTAVLGLLELSRGDPEAAHLRLGPLSQMIVAIGLGEPGVVRFIPDEIEALVELGELQQAGVLTAMLEERGAALDRPWAIATGARSAALVAAASGEFEDARVAIGRSLSAHERLGQPFELARTLLAEGMIERRAKKRAVARQALTDALEIFDSLGAPLWAERTAAELARIPGRPPGAGELTSTERRIAELVAAGLSNKEVAAKLYVTVRTVEWNLSKVYAKLGARSRTELSARLAENP